MVLFDSYALLLYRSYYSSLLVNTMQFCGYGSNACLELVRIHYSANTRLSSSLPIGEPGNEANIET